MLTWEVYFAFTIPSNQITVLLLMPCDKAFNSLQLTLIAIQTGFTMCTVAICLLTATSCSVHSVMNTSRTEAGFMHIHNYAHLRMPMQINSYIIIQHSQMAQSMLQVSQSLGLSQFAMTFDML